MASGSFSLVGSVSLAGSIGSVGSVGSVSRDGHARVRLKPDEGSPVAVAE
ncbi:hypothetical protein [Paractinoplanes maris]|nr:hypothetical protein [Actinoplanes maris]